MSIPEVIPLAKLQKHANNNLFVDFSKIKSTKSAPCLKEWGDKEPVVPPTYDISNKNECYLAALQHIVITQNNTEEITEYRISPCPPDTFNSNWSKYPGNALFDLKHEINIELQKLYIRGGGG